MRNVRHPARDRAEDDRSHPHRLPRLRPTHLAQVVQWRGRGVQGLGLLPNRLQVRWFGQVLLVGFLEGLGLLKGNRLCEEQGLLVLKLERFRFNCFECIHIDFIHIEFIDVEFIEGGSFEGSSFVIAPTVGSVAGPVDSR